MPHQTFFNLPEDKQKRILDVCIHEFAEKTYHKASISQMVKDSNIAKGSFYQYFEDKLDIFKYIISYIGQQKMAYFLEVLPQMHEKPFFELLKGFYVAGTAFAKDHPELTKIGNFIMKTDDEGLKKAIMADGQKESDDFMKILIMKAVERGEVRSDIEVDFISHMIQAMSLSAVEYYFKKHDSLADSDDDLISMTHAMVDVLEQGLRRKN